MAAVLEEFALVVRADFKESEFKALKDNLESIFDKAKKVASVFYEVSKSIGASIRDIADEAGSLSRLSDSTGVAIEDLQALGYAAESEGASASEFRDTILSLTKSIGDAELGRGAEGFRLIGVGMRKSNGELKNSLDLLLDISDAIKDIPAHRQLQRIGQLGISPEMLPLLRAGSDGIKKYVEDANKSILIDKEMGNRSRELVKNIANLKLGFKGLKLPLQEIGVSLGNKILPVLSSGINLINKLFKAIDRKPSFGISSVIDKITESVSKLKIILKTILGLGIGGIIAGPVGAVVGAAGALLPEVIPEKIKNRKKAITEDKDFIENRVNEISNKNYSNKVFYQNNNQNNSSTNSIDAKITINSSGANPDDIAMAISEELNKIARRQVKNSESIINI